MRHIHIVIVVSLLISAILAGGYFAFTYNGENLNANTPSSSILGINQDASLSFNPANEGGMIVILAIMVVLSAVVMLKRSSGNNIKNQTHPVK